jgi:dsDNA-specific endonuclease/ATPase MutS2
LQLKEFEKWYELALAHHLTQSYYYSWVGSGKLRDEIHDILKNKKRSKNFR